jgi:PAS domain S-box-containing protein
MDINLGKGIDGTEAARQILNRHNIPIVFLTSHSEKEYVDRVKEITRYGYVIKNSGDFVLQSSIEMAFELFESHQKTKESKTRYKTTLNSIGDAVISTDIKGMITGMNPVAIELTGWTEEEVLGKPLNEVFNIVNELTREQVENPVDKVLKEGLIVGLANHTILISKDGREIPIADSGAPIIDESNQITGVVLVFRDQSQEYLQQRLTEIMLSLSEYAQTHSLNKLLTKILDEIGKLLKSPIGFYHFVEEDQITLTLQSWSSKTINEYCHTKVEKKHYPIDKAGVWVDCVREGKTVIHNDYASLPHKKGLPEGHAPVIRELVVPVFRNNRIMAILGVGNKETDYDSKDIEIANHFTDSTWEIVERKRNFEKLQESRRRYQEIFDRSRDGFVMVDEDGCFIDANQAFCLMVGYSIDELQNMDDFYQITPERWVKWEYEEIWKKRLIRNGFSGIYEKEYIRKDGTVFPVELQSYTVFKEDGSIDYLWGVARDITERKQAEERLNFQALVLDQIQDRITVTDLKGYITYVNQAECRMFNKTKEEFIGKHVSIYGENSKKGVSQDEIIKQTYKNGQWRGEVINFKPDGSEIILDSRTYKITNKDGEPIALCGISTDITDYKRTEEALLEYKNKLDLALYAANMGIWDWDVDTGKIDWSGEHASLFGIPIEDFGGTIDDVQDMVHPDDREQGMIAFRQTIETEADFDNTYRVVWPDGSIHWLNSYGKLIRDDLGNPQRIIGTTQEVTERIQTEEELKRANDIINRTPAVAVVWKTEEGWPIEYISDNVQQLLGWSKEELLSENVYYSQIIHPDDLEQANKEVDMFSAEKDRKAFTHQPYRIITSKGNIKWVEDITTIKRDEKGNIIAYEGLIMDITERVEAEKAYKLIWDMADDLICVADINTASFVKVNPAFEKVLGYSEEELISKPFLDFIHPDDVESTKEVIREKLREGVSVIAFENRYRCKDGSYRWLNWNSHPIPDRGMTYAIAHDTTTRKMNEERIKKLLEEKNIILKEVHHRIKNNMNTIVSLLKLQSKSMTNKEAVKALKNAQSRVRSMQVLYDKLYRSTDFQKTSIRDYLTTLIDEIVGNFEHRNEIVIEKEINDFIVDAKIVFSIGIIVNELLTNSMKYAFDYGKNGKKRIKVSTTKDDGRVLLLIQDNGKGLPQTISPDKAPGFGLRLVDMLSKQIDGKINIERDKGTKFILEFELND